MSAVAYEVVATYPDGKVWLVVSASRPFGALQRAAIQTRGAADRLEIGAKFTDVPPDHRDLVVIADSRLPA